MIALYDHLIAVLVAGIIVLLLFNVQKQAQKTSVEHTMMHMAKKETLGLATLLERDLSNAGYETPPIEPGVLAHRTRSDGVTDTLIFWGIGANGQRTRIAYGVSQVDSAMIDGDMQPIYELRRYERRGSNFVQVGGSKPVLTRFSIDLLDENNNPADTDETRRFRVRFVSAVLPSYTSGTYLRGYRQLHWAITLSASGLQNFVRQ